MKTNHQRLIKASILAAILVLAIGFRATGEMIKVRGQIATLDTTNYTFVVKDKTGPELLTLAMTSHTRLFKYGEPATVSDLKVGDEVRGTADRHADGKIEALRIYVVKAAPQLVAINGQIR